MLFYPQYGRQPLTFVSPINAVCVTKHRQNTLFSNANFIFGKHQNIKTQKSKKKPFYLKKRKDSNFQLCILLALHKDLVHDGGSVPSFYLVELRNKTT